MYLSSKLWQHNSWISVAYIHGLFHEGVLDEGFCHLQEVEVDWDVACRSYLNVSVIFSVVSRENEGNEAKLLRCIRPSNHTWICAGSELMSATYDTISDTLKIGFTFNNTIFGGQLLRSKTLCNGNPKLEHFLLKACRMFIQFYKYLRCRMICFI